jgi:hypothetical protein
VIPIDDEHRLELQLMAMQADVDRAAAEYRDPATTAVRREQILTEFRRMYDALVELRGQGA